MGHSFGTNESEDGVTGWTRGPHAAGVAGNSALGRIGLELAATGVGSSSPCRGVFGYHRGLNSGDGVGVHGESTTGAGVVAVTHDASQAALYGHNIYLGHAHVNPPGGSGVFGHTDASGGAGVFGANNGTKGVGVQGNGPEAGVSGFSPGGNGLKGFSQTGYGLLAQSADSTGIVATSETGQGISVFSDNDIAVFARGALWSGVFEGAVVIGKGPDPKKEGVSRNPDNGNLRITEGTIYVDKGDVILGNSDCAEDFDIAFEAAAGTVMTIDETGALRPCTTAYDKKVAGVLSGAGALRPALVLGRQTGSNKPTDGRAPLALIGKVYCKVDASYQSIEIGDLLTTSPTIGHAMRATDPLRAFGAVIGKAMQPKKDGQGLIPILVALQ